MIGKRVRHRKFEAEGVVVGEKGVLLKVEVKVCGSLDPAYVGCVYYFDRRWVDIIEENDKLVDIIVYGTEKWRAYILKMEKESKEMD